MSTDNKKKVLLLGCTGKMGLALGKVLGTDYEVIGKSSRDFDALDTGQVRLLIEANRPDIVINTVAFMGIDLVEREPEKAIKINALHPKMLAELSCQHGFVLVHFSTEAVFCDSSGEAYTEGDCPRPVNVYGLTKYGGDCFVQRIARRYYIFRMPIMFGEAAKDRQFVEKMLSMCSDGSESLRISDDIISSPTYSLDAAKAIAGMLEAEASYGLYHLANEGRASLWELMNEVVAHLGLPVEVKRASYQDFPCVGIKNICTPLRSQKIASLRPWKEAVRDYCANLRAAGAI